MHLPTGDRRWWQGLVAGLVTGLLAAVATPQVVRGAEGGTDPAIPDVRIEEIVVTAQKREDPGSRVPISVVALPAPELDDAGAFSTEGLPLLVPGLVYSTNSVIGFPYLRGVGSDLLTIGGEASVSTYVDEVYRARGVSSLLDFYDVERVEVLRGPQGTLFGRNATGGVVQVVTRRPGPELGGEAELGYGSFNDVRLRGAVNVPLAQDSIRVRLAGLGNWRDGYLNNRYLDELVDNANVGAGRGQAEILLRPDLTLLLEGDYARERDSHNLAPKVIPPFSGSPAVSELGGIVPSDTRDVFYDTAPSADVEQWGGLARLVWTPEVGELVSLSAFRASSLDETLDLDATQVPFLVNLPTESSDTYSQEVRYASPPGNGLEYLVGLFYLHEDARQSLLIESPILAPGGFSDQTFARVESDSIAVFGDVSYRFLDSLRGVIGLRYTYDWRSENFREVTNGVHVAPFEQSDDWSAPTPRFVLEWEPRDELFAYASIARGYKAGGYNSTVAQPFPFDPEYVWAYEIGAKTPLLDRALRLEVAGFYYDWEDMQLNVADPAISTIIPVVKNAGSANVLGLDLTVAWQPSASALVNVSAEFLDGTFSDLVAIDPNDPTADPVQDGNRLPRAPAASLHADAAYDFSLGRLGVLTPRLDYRYQSRIFFNVWEDPLVAQSPFGLLSFLLRWGDASGRFYASAYVRNLTNELYAQNKVRVDGQFGNLAFWAAPRQAGFELGARF